MYGMIRGRRNICIKVSLIVSFFFKYWLTKKFPLTYCVSLFESDYALPYQWKIFVCVCVCMCGHVSFGYSEIKPTLCPTLSALWCCHWIWSNRLFSFCFSLSLSLCPVEIYQIQYEIYLYTLHIVLITSTPLWLFSSCSETMLSSWMVWIWWCLWYNGRFRCELIFLL